MKAIGIAVVLAVTTVGIFCQEYNETDLIEGCITSRSGEAVFRVSGVPGPVGPLGPPGPRGEKGANGSVGAKGEQGSKGDKGEQGQGLQGTTGMKGDKGSKGKQGGPGNHGPIGKPGLPGAQGPTGPPGRDGNEGRTGSVGFKGSTGLPGLPGAPGAIGPPGIAELSTRDYNFILTNLTKQLNLMLRESQCKNRCTPKSCDEILQNNPHAPNGYYFVGNGPYQPVHRVYCVMERTLCGETGGWVRTAYIDMTNSSEKCPAKLLEYKRTNRAQRACGKPVTAGTYEITFLSYNITYSKVCGRVRGYQVGSPDAFSDAQDGIQITQGTTTHLWSYIAGWSETRHALSCPCAGSGYRGTIPIANNYYYCESGSDGRVPVSDNNKVFWDDPLWDGANCPSGNSCCDNYGWFARNVSKSSDDIKLKWQLDEPKTNEDVYVDIVEIYIK